MLQILVIESNLFITTRNTIIKPLFNDTLTQSLTHFNTDISYQLITTLSLQHLTLVLKDVVIHEEARLHFVTNYRSIVVRIFLLHFNLITLTDTNLDQLQ